MATQKRRVIYFSDKEWADLQEWASDQGLSASAFIRRAVGSLRSHPIKDQVDLAVGVVSGQISQAERDRILRRISKSS